jgi:hypothetical protein
VKYIYIWGRRGRWGKRGREEEDIGGVGGDLLFKGKNQYFHVNVGCLSLYTKP